MARYKVVRVIWEMAYGVPRLARRSLARRVREISIPAAPNNGVLTEQELIQYVNSLRLVVRLLARRHSYGNHMRLQVLGGPNGMLILGEAGHRGGRVYARSLPDLSEYRYYRIAGSWID